MYDRFIIAAKWPHNKRQRFISPACLINSTLPSGTCLGFSLRVFESRRPNLDYAVVGNIQNCPLVFTRGTKLLGIAAI